MDRDHSQASQGAVADARWASRWGCPIWRHLNRSQRDFQSKRFEALLANVAATSALLICHASFLCVAKSRVPPTTPLGGPPEAVRLMRGGAPLEGRGERVLAGDARAQPDLMKLKANTSGPSSLPHPECLTQSSPPYRMESSP
eukprot:3846546-Pyramimonas_sp.AAC.2